MMTFTTIHLDTLFAECTDSLLRGDCHVATKLAIGEACRIFILRGDVCHGHVGKALSDSFEFF